MPGKLYTQQEVDTMTDRLIAAYEGRCARLERMLQVARLNAARVPKLDIPKFEMYDTPDTLGLVVERQKQNGVRS